MIIKTYDIFIAPAFKEELENIYNYIVIILDNPRAAKSIYDKIIAGVRSLDYMPQRFPLWNDTDYHKMVVGKYMIFYSVDEEMRIVNINRILYSGRDINMLAIS